MRDIIVTTPKSQSATAEKEAQDCIKAKGGYYFRVFRNPPENSGVGRRIFYVEDGYVRGFAMITRVARLDRQTCETTGRVWQAGTYFFLDAATWKWIKPIPMKGFQGWRYFDDDVEVVGDWLDPKPKT